MFVALMAIILSVLVRSLLKCTVKEGGGDGFCGFVCFCIIDKVFIPFTVLVVPIMGRATRVKLTGETKIVVLCIMFCVPVGMLLCSKCLAGVPLTLRRTTYISNTDA